MKCFVCLIAACAASALFVQGQSGRQTSNAPAKVIWKPDFTIPNAGAQRGGVIAYSANGQLLAVGFEKVIRIYDVRRGDKFGAKLTRSLASDSLILAITFRANTFISLSADGSVTTWNASSGEMLHHLSLQAGDFSTATFAPGNQPLLAAATGERVMLWNYQSGELLNTSEATDSTVSALAFTPEGKLLVVGTHKGVVRVEDVAARKITRTIDLDSPVCALSASMKYILLGYSDGTLAQLSFGGGTSTHEVSGHNAAVTTIAFSPQGERFASGSTDGMIKLWDADSLKLLASLNGSAAAIFSIVFSADSQTLVSITTNGVINGWSLPINP